MHTQYNQAIVRRVFSDIANNGVYDVADQIYTADYVDHNPFPGAPPGREGAKYSIGSLRAALPDLHVTVEAMSAFEDMVATHNTWSGTHEGEVLGIAPTGRRVSFGGVVVFRMVDGLIAERWAIGLELNLLKELGMNLRWSKPPAHTA